MTPQRSIAEQLLERQQQLEKDRAAHIATLRGPFPPLGVPSETGTPGPRQVLEAKRGEALAHLASLRGDILVDRVAEPQENAANTMARDGATAEIERARTMLGLVEAALARLDSGTYGICECGQTISEKRLAAVPETARCLSCAVARVLA